MDSDQLSALADATRRFGLLQQTPRFSAERGRMAEAMADPLLAEKAAELHARTGQTEAETAAIPQKLAIQEETAKALGGYRSAQAQELLGRNPTKEAVAAINAGPKYAAAYAQQLRALAEQELNPARKQKLLAEADMAEAHAGQYRAIAALGGGMPKAVPTVDAQGNPSTMFFTPAQEADMARSGTGVARPESGQAESQRRTSQAMLGSLDDIKEQLHDPVVRANLGMFAGRGLQAKQYIGGDLVPPELSGLRASIHGYMMANYAAHGYRSAEDMERTLADQVGPRLDPDNIESALNGFAQIPKQRLKLAPHAGGTSPAAPAAPGLNEMHFDANGNLLQQH